MSPTSKKQYSDLRVLELRFMNALTKPLPWTLALSIALLFAAILNATRLTETNTIISFAEHHDVITISTITIIVSVFLAFISAYLAYLEYGVTTALQSARAALEDAQKREESIGALRSRLKEFESLNVGDLQRADLRRAVLEAYLKTAKAIHEQIPLDYEIAVTDAEPNHGDRPNSHR